MRWSHELQKVAHCPQRQDGTSDQLYDLIEIANKFGLTLAAKKLETLNIKKVFQSSPNAIWVSELKKVEQCDSLNCDVDTELKWLRIIAIRFGFYDAADFLKK